MQERKQVTKVVSLEENGMIYQVYQVSFVCAALIKILSTQLFITLVSNYNSIPFLIDINTACKIIIREIVKELYLVIIMG